ncbi:MAG TPA: zinc ribbon domain-containing protein [Actinomycetota bacterium]|nr:zinc ribbon domain-containing protein [Actinomycetota bacterium]
MATYEYLCLACEHAFEERRPMTSSVDTALACPSCGSDRVRRRFSFAAGLGSATTGSAGGCACGGACACGH